MKRWWWALAIGLGVLAVLGFVVFGTETPAVRIGVSGTVFAGAIVLVEVMRHLSDTQERTRAARIKLEGAAWLARRSCEALIGSFATHTDIGARRWAAWIADRPTYGSLEDRLRDVLDLAAEAGGDEHSVAREAFDGFIAFADRINDLSDPMNEYTHAASDNIGREADRHLRRTALCLERFAPRRIHEPPVLAPRG